MEWHGSDKLIVTILHFWNDCWIYECGRASTEQRCLRWIQRSGIPKICRHWDTWEPFLMWNNSSEKDYWFRLIVEECDDNDEEAAVGNSQRSCHCHLLEANSLKWLLVIYWKLLAAGCCCDKNVGIPHILNILFWLNLSRQQMELEQLHFRK